MRDYGVGRSRTLVVAAAAGAGGDFAGQLGAVLRGGGVGVSAGGSKRRGDRGVCDDGGGAVLLAWVAWDSRRWWGPRLRGIWIGIRILLMSLGKAGLWFWIALAAGTGLYFELVVIRFHASCFQLFAFFKNVSLLSCFLGLGMGYCLSGRRLYTPLVVPLMAVQLCCCMRCGLRGWRSFCRTRFRSSGIWDCCRRRMCASGDDVWISDFDICV